MIAVIFEVKPHADKKLGLCIAFVIRDCRKHECCRQAPTDNPFCGSAA